MIVLDASFVVAYFNEDDVHHVAAVGAWPDVVDGRWGPVLLPEYIFLEVVTVLASRRGLERAVSGGTQLLDASQFEFVNCSPYFLSAFEAFRIQRSTKMSLADASVLAIAKARSADHVATFDRDFRKVPGISVIPA